jgi:hypothetical protein
LQIPTELADETSHQLVADPDVTLLIKANSIISRAVKPTWMRPGRRCGNACDRIRDKLVNNAQRYRLIHVQWAAISVALNRNWQIAHHRRFETIAELANKCVAVQHYIVTTRPEALMHTWYHPDLFNRVIQSRLGLGIAHCQISSG